MSALDEVKQREQDGLKQYGFYAHCVIDDPDSPTGFNYHTHGILEIFNHPDFQIVLNIHPNLAHVIVMSLVEHIKSGARYQPEIPYVHIIEKFPVKFIQVDDGGRSVLRLIFPDPTGEFEEYKMTDRTYKKQFQKTGFH